MFCLNNSLITFGRYYQSRFFILKYSILSIWESIMNSKNLWPLVFSDHWTGRNRVWEYRCSPERGDRKEEFQNHSVSRKYWLKFFQAYVQSPGVKTLWGKLWFEVVEAIKKKITEDTIYVLDTWVTHFLNDPLRLVMVQKICNPCCYQSPCVQGETGSMFSSQFAIFRTLNPYICAHTMMQSWRVRYFSNVNAKYSKLQQPFRLYHLLP